MEKRRIIYISIFVLCIISIAINIFLIKDKKDKELIIENMEKQYNQQNDAKLYGVLDQIVIDWDFSKMSEKKINKVLTQNITYCNSAIYLVNGTKLSDDEGSFCFALKYTEYYLSSLLSNKKLIGTEECNKALEEISAAFYSAIYLKDKESIKEYERVAKLYSGK